MNKVAICGRFDLGRDNCHINGQATKTISIHDELKNSGFRLIRIKTDSFLNKIFSYFKLFVSFIVCSDIVFLPATRGLKSLSPFLCFLKKLFGKKIHYVVVGGWLADYLKSNKRLLKNIIQFDYIYVETYAMLNDLHNLGLLNVCLMHNFKPLHSKMSAHYYDKPPYRLCTFSRVMFEKGIEDAVEAVKELNKLGFECILDIYGPIDQNQRQWFENLRSCFPDYINYCGTISPDRSISILSKYFCLLFPTFYNGEGLAGTLIDSMFCGLPTICSNWKYNSEIINHRVSGILFEPRRIEQIVLGVKELILDKKLWLSIHKTCLLQSSKYEPKSAIKVLVSNLKPNRL